MTAVTRPYPAYKPSGVEWLGDVPAHWTVIPVKYRFEVRLGKMLQSEPATRYDTREPYLRAANIVWGRVDLSDLKEMWFSPHEKRVLALEVDDLMVSEGGDVGRSAIWNGELEPCFYQNAVNRVRGKGNGSTKFLFYWLFFLKQAGFIDVLCNKATIAHYTAVKVANTQVAFPSRDEEQAIVAYLDRETAHIETLIAKKRELIGLLERQRTALISHAVTKGLDSTAPLRPSGVEWLGDVPAHWEVWKIAHIFRQIGSGTTPPTNNQEYYDGSISWVTTSELRDDIIQDTLKKVSEDAVREFAALRIYPPETLLIALYGATIGRIGLLKIEASTNQACCALASPRNMLPWFSFYCLLAGRGWLMSMAYGGGQPNVSQGIVRNFKLPLPPLSEQRAIVELLDRETAHIDRLTGEIEASLDLLERQRTALISAAVTGRIDVRGEA